MALIDEVAVGDAEVLALSTREEGMAFVRTVIWLAYDRFKNQKLPGFLGFLGQRISNFHWLIVLLVGNRV